MSKNPSLARRVGESAFYVTLVIPPVATVLGVMYGWRGARRVAQTSAAVIGVSLAMAWVAKDQLTRRRH